jgi:integrase
MGNLAKLGLRTTTDTSYPHETASVRADKILDDGLEFKAQKTGKKLIVRWTPELRVEVEKAKALGGKVSALYLFFATKGATRGQPPSYKTIRNQWKAACKAAEITDTTMRDIRAMAATNAEEQGKNATALLDHSSPQTTKRYLRGRKANSVDGASFRQSIDSEENS